MPPTYICLDYAGTTLVRHGEPNNEQPRLTLTLQAPEGLTHNVADQLWRMLTPLLGGLISAGVRAP